jgi:hypothetical protein
LCSSSSIKDEILPQLVSLTPCITPPTLPSPPPPSHPPTPTTHTHLPRPFAAILSCTPRRTRTTGSWSTTAGPSGVTTRRMPPTHTSSATKSSRPARKYIACMSFLYLPVCVDASLSSELALCRIRALPHRFVSLLASAHTFLPPSLPPSLPQQRQSRPRPLRRGQRSYPPTLYRGLPEMSSSRSGADSVHTKCEEQQVDVDLCVLQPELWA